MASQVTVRVFNAEKKDVEGVSLTVLRLEKEWRMSARDFYELVADMKERYKSTPNKVVVLIRPGRGSSEAEYIATISTIDKGMLLFPEPAKLKAIYIAGEDLKPRVKQALSLFKRIEFNDDIYVYQGDIVLGDGVKLVVLETEKGIKVITRDSIKE